jgi:nucleotide-binding universal stress UspA family protein
LQAVPIPELKQRYEEEERETLAELQSVADQAGASAEAGPGESPSQGLQWLAEELEPDIVVVGSSHRGRVGQVLAGNVALRLLNGLDRPLAVAPAGYAETTGKVESIGVGFTATPESRAAVRTAGELAQAANAKVRVIGVGEPHSPLVAHPWGFGWQPGPDTERHYARPRGELESAARGLPAGVQRTAEFHIGGVAAVLGDYAQWVDLLVLGSRGYGPIRRVLVGSVSSELVRGAACPVLVVPRPQVRDGNEHLQTVDDAVRA